MCEMAFFFVQTFVTDRKKVFAPELARTRYFLLGDADFQWETLILDGGGRVPKRPLCN